MRRQPPAPSSTSTPANLSSRRLANRTESSDWSALRTLTAKYPADRKAGKLRASLSRLQRRRGGSNETELKLLAVTPTDSPEGPLSVTTVTPVGKLPRALRKA